MGVRKDFNTEVQILVVGIKFLVAHTYKLCHDIALNTIN